MASLSLLKRMFKIESWPLSQTESWIWRTETPFFIKSLSIQLKRLNAHITLIYKKHQYFPNKCRMTCVVYVVNRSVKNTTDSSYPTMKHWWNGAEFYSTGRKGQQCGAEPETKPSAEINEKTPTTATKTKTLITFKWAISAVWKTAQPHWNSTLTRLKHHHSSSGSCSVSSWCFFLFFFFTQTFNPFTPILFPLRSFNVAKIAFLHFPLSTVSCVWWCSSSRSFQINFPQSYPVIFGIFGNFGTQNCVGCLVAQREFHQGWRSVSVFLA